MHGTRSFARAPHIPDIEETAARRSTITVAAIVFAIRTQKEIIPAGSEMPVNTAISVRSKNRLAAPAQAANGSAGAALRIRLPGETPAIEESTNGAAANSEQPSQSYFPKETVSKRNPRTKQTLGSADMRPVPKDAMQAGVSGMLRGEIVT